uniref:Uncharacterized protein n=1 Tax=Leersia perrieri TaxID=77586 RepID=A0A0D9X034_9ORYZ
MAVLVSIDGEIDGGIGAVINDPAPIDINGDDGDGRDGGGEGEGASRVPADGDSAEIVPTAGDGGGFPRRRIGLSDLPDDEAMASWLRVAAPLVTGELMFHNRCSVEQRGAFEMPCFTRATRIWQNLGFLGLSLPPTGVFAALRDLQLKHVQFHGECNLNDAMFPCLEWLGITMSRGIDSLTLRLKHLIWTNLHVRGLRQLNAVLPRLRTEGAGDAPVGRLVVWYLRGLVNFKKMPHLQMICPYPVHPYRSAQYYHNQICLKLIVMILAQKKKKLIVMIQPE